MVNAPTEALLGRPLIATGTGTPTASAVVQVDAAGPVPENAYPYVGINQLTFTASVNNGVQILDYTIQQQLALGNTVSVYRLLPKRGRRVAGNGEAPGGRACRVRRSAS